MEALNVFKHNGKAQDGTGARLQTSPMTDTLAARRAAFGNIARQYETDLLRAANRMCRGDMDRAHDLVQDALIRAYQAYADGRFTEGSNARSWLLRIVTNLFINEYHRRQKWDAGVDLDTLTASGEAGPPETHAASEDIPGVKLLKDIFDEEIERALNCLPEAYRLCVMIVDVEGLDYAEAAEALQVPIGTVRSRLSRGRLQLHELLYEYGQSRGLVK